MAWIEKRGKRFRLLFRFNNEKFTLNLKAGSPREAETCLSRVEENIRLVERGRLSVPEGAALALQRNAREHIYAAVFCGISWRRRCGVGGSG